jgi:PAS domain S-box-containing protein
MTSENPELESRLKAALERVAELERELKRSEGALADLDIWFRAAIDSIPGDFFAIGPDGRYVQQNSICRERWCDLIGKFPEEAVGSSDTLNIWLENNKRAFAGETIRNEVELEANGEKRFFFNVITPVRDQDKICGILGVNIDITDRKKAELALRESQEVLEDLVDERTAELLDANKKLTLEIEDRKQAEAALRQSKATIHALMDSISESMLLFGEDEILLAINVAGARRFGGKPEDFIGLKACEFIPDEVYQRRSDQRKEVLRTVRPVRHRDRRDGRTFDAKMYPVMEKSGDVRLVAVFGEDITDRVKAEEALRKANESLAYERRQLQEKNIALREMIAQIDLQKKRTEASVQSNVDRTIAPILMRLEKVLPTGRRYEIRLLQKALSDITSPFVNRLESVLDKLTARETEVCDLIRRGYQAKEIAEVLSLSVSTVNKFRQKIRKKLGISGQKICTHLRSLQTDD